MRMLKRFLSLVLYHIGDYVGEVAFNYDIEHEWLYKLYNKLMIISSELDTRDEIWKTVQQ